MQCRPHTCGELNCIPEFQSSIGYIIEEPGFAPEVTRPFSGAYLGGVLWVLEHPPQSLAQTLKATASGPPQSTETMLRPGRVLSGRSAFAMFSSTSRIKLTSRSDTLYVTRYEKTYHSQENMIFQYGVLYLTQRYFFIFFFFADYESMVFPLLISKISCQSNSV